MIFSAHSTPTRPAIELRSVRRALNTPVLAIAELPVGPGSAVIAIHADPRAGIPHYTVAVRCERSRGVVFFSAAEESFRLAESSLAAEAALSFAESMGFLFDEDMPAISGAAAALIWEEYVGSAQPGAAMSAPPGPLPLTKFRRSLPWSVLRPAVNAVGGDARTGFIDVEAGFAASDSQFARQGGS